MPVHLVRSARSTVQLPWAEAGGRFTALFEALAIEWMEASSQLAVAQLLRVSWDQVHGILERAVERGLERRKQEPLVHLGVDEKAFRKGHNYLTLVNDLSGSRVLCVAEDRQQSSLDGFWGTLTEEQKAGIEAAALRVDLRHELNTMRDRIGVRNLQNLVSLNTKNPRPEPAPILINRNRR